MTALLVGGVIGGLLLAGTAIAWATIGDKFDPHPHYTRFDFLRELISRRETP